MKIRVKSVEVETVRIKGRNGEFDSRRQSGYIETGDEIRRVDVPLLRDQTPYALGLYMIDDRSYRVNDFGRLEIGRLVLSPLTSARAA